MLTAPRRPPPWRRCPRSVRPQLRQVGCLPLWDFGAGRQPSAHVNHQPCGHAPTSRLFPAATTQSPPPLRALRASPSSGMRSSNILPTVAFTNRHWSLRSCATRARYVSLLGVSARLPLDPARPNNTHVLVPHLAGNVRCACQGDAVHSARHVRSTLVVEKGREVYVLGTFSTLS